MSRRERPGRGPSTSGGPPRGGTCFYAVLGVEATASEQDIRRAYRSLSLRYHPDKNPDDRAEAEERFKAIAEAYAVLSDPQQRAEYDGRGARHQGDGAGARGHHFRDHHHYSHASVDPFRMFEEVFGAMFGARPRARGGRGASMLDDLFDGFGDDHLFSAGFGGPMGGGRGGLLDQMMGDMMMGDMMFDGGNLRGQGPRGGGGGQFAGGGAAMQRQMRGAGFGGSSSSSTSTQTVIRDGVRVTRTTRTVVGPDGSVQTSTEEHHDTLDPRAGPGSRGLMGFGGGGFLM